MLKYSIIGGVLFGSICAYAAKKKNLNQLGWFALGFSFGVFALIVLTFLKGKKVPAILPELEPLFPSESPLTEKMWYYLTPEQEQVGPMSYNALERAYRADLITDETYLWNDNLDNWQPLSTIKD